MKDSWRLFRRDHPAGSLWVMYCTGVTLPDEGASAGRSLCTVATIELEHPTPNGLGTSDEVDGLEEAVTVLEQDLERKFDALFVARIRGHGKIELVIYSAQQADHPVLELIESSFADREVTVSQIQDLDWSVYQRCAPNSEEHWRVLLDESTSISAEHGDEISLTRIVDHFSYFPDKARSREFAVRTKPLGMKSNIRPAADPSPAEAWLVLSHHRCTALTKDLLPIVLKLVDIAKECDGRYDGWEMPVARTTLWGRIRRLFGAD